MTSSDCRILLVTTVLIVVEQIPQSDQSIHVNPGLDYMTNFVLIL